eukprot:221397-Karenia_brevis.AAC.1
MGTEAAPHSTNGREMLTLKCCRNMWVVPGPGPSHHRGTAVKKAAYRQAHRMNQTLRRCQRD